MLGQEYIKAEKKDNKTEKKFYDFGPPPDKQTDPPFLYQKKQKPNKAKPLSWTLRQARSWPWPITPVSTPTTGKRPPIPNSKTAVSPISTNPAPHSKYLP